MLPEKKQRQYMVSFPSSLVAQFVVAASDAPWRLTVVPLVLLVRVDVEHVLLGGTVLVPLLLAVAVDATVVTVVCVQSQVQRRSVRRRLHRCHGNGTVDADHRLSLRNRLRRRRRRFVGLMTQRHQLNQRSN